MLQLPKNTIHRVPECWGGKIYNFLTQNFQTRQTISISNPVSTIQLPIF